MNDICNCQNCDCGEIKKATTTLSLRDKLESILVRFGFGRMDHVVDPGLYAINNPTKDSPVLVSANYKLTFDVVRSQLKGIDCYILVIDTKGINVWCAAGKGTFGTDEIVNRIEKVKLSEVVSHRKIILPQLGAPGTSAHEVQRRSGFQVVYGPVRADDIPEFLSNGMEVTKEMRKVRFNLNDRMQLVPMELTMNGKYAVLTTLLYIIVAIIFNKIGFGVRAFVNIFLTYLAASILGPAMLPRLPGRSFSMKGLFLGLFVVGAACYFNLIGNNPYEALSWMLIIPTISSFILMNFTGASTYTSLSGVQKEMKISVPLQIVAGVIGVVFWVLGVVL